MLKDTKSSIGRRNMYLAASLGLVTSMLTFVLGVYLSDFIRSSLPEKEISSCSPSFLGDRSLKSHARVINQSNKDIRFAWIGSNSIEESPFNLHPGQIEDIHGVINDAVCIIDLSSAKMIANPLLSFNQQTIIVSGSSDLRIDIYPSNLGQ